MAGPTGTGAPTTGNGGWTPTVANLIVLVGLEIVAYVALRWAFRKVNGG